MIKNIIKSISLVYLLSVLILNHTQVKAQVVYEHTSNTGIYQFLDELANQQWIEINSAIKPFSRTYIAAKLLAAEKYTSEMNKRQRAELAFYKKGFGLEIYQELHSNPKLNPFKKAKGLGFDINPLGVFYKDSLFSFQAQFLYGYSFMKNDNGSNYYGYGGLQGYGYVGKHFGFYASLRDMHYEKVLNSAVYLNPIPGGNFKGSTTRDGVDWSEMRGGITYQWQWGEVAVVKDHFEWGDNQHGANIFSGKQPSFGQIRLKLKPAPWLEFNYVHGWLVSEVVDSSKSYMDGNAARPRFRAVFWNKWLSANMFTIRPIKGLNLSIGNSVIYSDTDNIAYWIPLFIYKPVDHTYNATEKYGQAGQNSQLFANVSIRLIKHVHLYGAVYSDEIQFGRITKSDKHNFWSWKGGFQISDWLVNNYSFTFEFTRTLPGTFQHPISTTTFASNRYNLGHFLGDNAEEFYAALSLRPIRGLHLKGEVFLQRHGPLLIYDTGYDIVGTPFMERVAWKNKTFAFTANYELFNNINLFAKATASNISGDKDLVELWTPEYYRGKQLTMMAGFQIGL